jgi:hypothetical protein
VAGWAFDATGRYTGVIAACAALSLLAAGAAQRALAAR